MNKPQIENKLLALLRSLINRKPSLWCVLPAIVIVAGIVVSAVFKQQAPVNAINTAMPAQINKQSTLIQNFAQLPLRFEQNQGQASDEIHYLSRSAGYNLYLTAAETVVTLPNHADKAIPGATIKTRLMGAGLPLAFQGQNKLPGKVNYLIGRNASDWISNIPTYAEVIAEQVYPGIDLRYHGNQQQLEYDFIVAPGARTDSIKLRFEGIKQLSLNDAGDLVLDTGQGLLHHKKPVIYQDINGERITIEGQYALHPSYSSLDSTAALDSSASHSTSKMPDVGFVIAAYDPAYPLIIDPVLDYSTYLGGESIDIALDVALDNSGHAYIAGKTFSSGFPVLSALQTNRQGNADSFVAKLSPTGDSLVYSTYFGSSGAGDESHGIAVNAAEEVFIVGKTDSSNDFPLVNAFQPNYGGGANDAYLVKLASDGGSILYSTFLGGNGSETALDVAVDSFDQAVVVGITGSSGFPLLNPLQTKLNKRGKDGFVAKFSVDGTSLVFSTFFGGTKEDVLAAVALDSSDRIYIVGQTAANTDFPIVNALQPLFGGSGDAFLARLQPDGEALDFSTYLGGTLPDFATAVSIDSSNHILITGMTWSNTDFPLVNPLQPIYGGLQDAFVTKLTPDATAIVFSTFLGGESVDLATDIGVDGQDNIFVTGLTLSALFPTADPLQTTFGGFIDAFAAKLPPQGDLLLFSSYLGGAHADEANALAVDPAGNMVIVGSTLSFDDFPLVNPLQSAIGGLLDAFVVKIGSDNLPPEITSTPITEAIVGQPYQYQVTAIDPDDDILTYTLQPAPAGMTIDANSSLISWTADAAGDFSVGIEVNDGKGGTANQDYVLSVSNPDIIAPTITITSLPDGSITNQDQLTLTGQLSEAAILTFNGVSVPVNPDSSFSIGPLTLIEGLNSFTLSATDSAGNVTTKIINITLDTVIPILTVDTPQDNTLTSQTNVFFSGSVSEAVNLTINAQAVTQNPDNSFATIIALTEGLNPVAIIATDAAGNADTVILNITVDTTPPALNIGLVNRGNPQNQIVMVAGLPGAAEPGALVHVINPTNSFEARVLAQSDGSFSTDVAGFANDSFQIFVEDAAGNQSATETLAANTPLSLTLDAIGNKIAPLGQTTRFTVTANDSAGNPVTLGLTPLPLPAGMIYNISTGELSFRPSNGQEGDYTLTFSALSGDEKVTETITVTVPSPNPADPTAFTGRVLDANSFTQGDLIPIVGASITFLGSNITATTDVDGYFTLIGLPSDAVLFDIDANSAQVAPDGTSYASFREGLTLVQNVLNQEERPFFLPRIDAASVTQVNPVATTVVSNPGLGITLTVPPHTAKNADGTDFTGQLSISEVPLALAPVALPDTFQPALLITVQPVGVTYSTPVSITYPNVDSLPPGSEVDLYQVDRDLGQFVVVGAGLVSADGLRIETISGGVTANTWGAPAPGPPDKPAPEDPVPPDPDDPPCNCNTGKGGSTIGLSDGRMGTNFSLPAYRSLEASRTLTFKYQSSRAFSRPVLPFNIGIRGAIPNTVSYTLSVAGLQQGKEVFISGAGLISGSVARSGFAFDGDDFASGQYSYQLSVSNNFFNTRIGNVFNGIITVENEEASVFGSGWLLEGLYRLAFNPDGSITLIAPAGHMTTYRPNGIPDQFDAPDSDFAVFNRNPDGSYTHTEKNGVKMHFDAAGLITEHQDRNNNITAYGYDTDGKLITITDPVGLITNLVYDNNGILQSVTDPASRVTTFTHDAAGNLNKVTFPDNTFEEFEYTNPDTHLITARFDERRNRYTYNYDNFGRIIDSTLPDGTVRAAANQTSKGLVDLESGQGTAVNPAPVFLGNEVDADYVDGRGNPSSKLIDPHGRTLMEIDEVGRVTQHQRDADSNPTQTTRPIGSVVTRSFDNFGNVLTQREQFNTATTSYTYDNFSLVTQVTNPRNHRTTINRDPANGNPLSIVNHLFHTTIMEYDSRGLVTRRVSPNSLETVYTYNAQGLMDTKTETPPTGSPGNIRLWTYSYFPTGLLQTVNTPDGITLTYQYDERSYLTEVTDNLNQTMIYSYDQHKNVIKTETSSSDGSLALLVDSIYDNRNRLTETRAPHAQVNGETTEESITQRILDENSNLTGLIDPNGNPSSNSYDPYNRLASNTHREQGITTYQYDDQDRMIKIIAPNEITTEYEYDIISRKTKEISPDRGTISYSYDLANNVISITEGRGITATMSYDELERLASKTYPNTIAGKIEDVSYTYDSCLFGLGFLCARDDESGSYDYDYDAYGNMTSGIFTEIAGTVYTMAYEYDDGDHITQMTMPSGRIVDYSRDGVRRVEAINTTLNGIAQNIVSSIQYRGDSQMLSCSYGNGLNDTRTYDLQGRLRTQQLNNSLNTIIDQRNYSYDKNSNITTIDTNLEDNAYQYDKLDRITGDTINAEIPNLFNYDLNDNRLSKTKQDLSLEDFFSYQTDSNRISVIETLKAGTIPIASSADRDLIYNDVGRLFQLIEDGSLNAEYIYNDQGQRTRKTVYQADGITVDQITIYHYSQSGNLITETTETGELIKDYIWQENTHPIAQIDSNAGTESIIYLYTDHLMTNRLATDQNQGIVWRWEGEAFGNTLAQELAGVSVNLRFPGQYFDGETNLHYNYYRYYDPQTGRYITSDPIGLDGGINTYGYVGGNPISYFDRDGLIICWSWGCKGDADNPNLLDDPEKKKNKITSCADKTTNLAACLACCSKRTPAEYSAEQGSICPEKCYRRAGITLKDEVFPSCGVVG